MFNLILVYVIYFGISNLFRLGLSVSREIHIYMEESNHLIYSSHLTSLCLNIVGLKSCFNDFKLLERRG